MTDPAADTQAARRQEEAGRLAQDPEISAPAELADRAGSERETGPGDARLAFDIPPDLADRLRASGKEWQSRAEAAIALWLDEASLALRKEGLPGLSRVIREKASESRQKARSGDFERDIERFVSNVAGSIGRDIMGSMFSAAVAGFTNSGGDRTRPTESGAAGNGDSRGTAETNAGSSGHVR